MIGEKSMPDGSIGQEPWQFPVAVLFGAVAFGHFVVCAALVAILFNGGGQKPTMWLVRLAGLSPFGAGASLVVAGGTRVSEAKYFEGIAALLFGLSLCAVGYYLLNTKQQEFTKS